MTQKVNSKKGKDAGRLNTLKPPPMTPFKTRANDALKPAVMTRLRGSSEDRGLKPGQMTPAPQPAPAQPVDAPAQPAQPAKE